MKHMKKVFCLFMAIAMTVSMLVGCGSSGSGEGSNDGATVKLGLIGPMTGDYANYGTSTRDGAQVAVDEINEAGRRQRLQVRPADRGLPGRSRLRCLRLR